MPFILPLLTLLILSTPCLAQEQTLEEKIELETKAAKNTFWTLTVENDLFGSGNDKYYTNGVRLSYFDKVSKNKDVKQFITDYIPFITPDETTAVYYSLGQNLYTPKDITQQTPNPNDRPYAAFLYGSVGLSTIEQNYLDEYEISLGIVGPAALGKQTQKFVHKLTNSPDPKGWDHQLKNEIGLILSYQRQWPETWTYDQLPYLYMRATPHAGFSLGNIYTHASVGGTLQIMPKDNIWQSPPLRIRPSIPGNSYFATKEKQTTWSLFLGAEQRLVGRNIFLDGNSFTNSASADKTHFVTDVSTGVSFGYGDIQLAYSLNWRSKEFKTQDHSTLFGALSLSYRY